MRHGAVATKPGASAMLARVSPVARSVSPRQSTPMTNPRDEPPQATRAALAACEDSFGAPRVSTPATVAPQADSRQAWMRLAVALALMTIGSSAMYVIAVVLPAVQ